MHTRASRAPTLAIAAWFLVTVGIMQGCGGSATTSTSTTMTGAVSSIPSSTTTTGAPVTSTTDATTVTTVPTTVTTVVTTTTSRPTGLPALAEVEGYKQWLKMNLAPIEGRTHGLTDIYINQERQTIAPTGELELPFPDGTVIVKEQVEGSLVAIMRKVAGIDPEHGDWQWIEYRTDGRVAGQDAQCWSCHTQAKGSDWVFTTLETP